MSDGPRAGQYVLGLDIGANSVGWALVQLDSGTPVGLPATGVRVFEAGVEGDIETGRDASRGADRRQARSRRRQLERRRRRLNRLAHVLQGAGLLPPGAVEQPEELMAFFNDLDRKLFPGQVEGPEAHVQLYRLRGRALSEKLEPYEIGRALYHLAQRRGFKSNRLSRVTPDAEKEEGKVKEGIAHLAERIRDSGSRTLGEYLSALDPSQQPVRRQWLGRSMLDDEFGLIWEAQARHYPDTLTEELQQRVHRAVFFQRPLKMQKRLIGQCNLEKGRQRAPMCLLAAQRFRLLQEVNDLEAITPAGEVIELTPEQRATLTGELESRGDLTFPRMRKALSFPRTWQFNLERKDEKRIIGNRTAAKLAQIFGSPWAGFSAEERERIVEDVRSITDQMALMRRGMTAWGLDEEAARQLSEVTLEAGYCNLSRQALAKVLPLMEQGVPYATARKQIYGDEPPPQPQDFVPPLRRVVEVRNPAVERALTETRRVVNAIVARYGKPDYIRIELARDLKKSRKQRQQIDKRNRTNQRARDEAKRQILARAGIPL